MVIISVDWSSSELMGYGSYIVSTSVDWSSCKLVGSGLYVVCILVDWSSSETVSSESMSCNKLSYSSSDVTPSKVLLIPAFAKPFTTNWGLLEINPALYENQLVLTFFKTGRPRSMGFKMTSCKGTSSCT